MYMYIHTRIYIYNVLCLLLMVLFITVSREYGELWHKNGCFEKRQNVYNDFHAAAEYLVQQKYTTSDKYTTN